MADVTAGGVLDLMAPGAGQTVRLPILLLDDNDAPVEGVAYNAAGMVVQIAKPGAALGTWLTVVGGAFASANWAEVGEGNYDIILDGDVAGEAAVLNTAGHLRVHVVCDATRGDSYLYKVVPADVTRDDQWTDLRAASLDTIAADVAGLDGDAIPSVETIQSGLATSANQTTILNRLGAWTGSAANTILGAIRALASKGATLPTDIGGTYDPETDSLEAIRDTEPLGTAMRGTDGAYTGTPPTVEQIQSGLATAAAVEAVDTVVDGIAAKTGNLPSSPAAVGSAMTLEAGAITAATIAADAIDADALAADLDSYGARVEIIDDDGAGTPADRYCVTWLRNMEMLTTGVTEPKIRVVKLADGTDLVAETALDAVDDTGAYQYVETANRIVDGAAYMVLVTATIAEATRTWPHFVGRDSAAT